MGSTPALPKLMRGRSGNADRCRARDTGRAVVSDLPRVGHAEPPAAAGAGSTRIFALCVPPPAQARNPQDQDLQFDFEAEPGTNAGTSAREGVRPAPAAGAGRHRL